MPASVEPSGPNSRTLPDGTDRRLGRRQKDGAVLHRSGRDLTLSAPKSVSIAALIGGDRQILAAHDTAVVCHIKWLPTGFFQFISPSTRTDWSHCAAEAAVGRLMVFALDVGPQAPVQRLQAVELARQRRVDG